MHIPMFANTRRENINSNNLQTKKIKINLKLLKEQKCNIKIENIWNIELVYSHLLYKYSIRNDWRLYELFEYSYSVHELLQTLHKGALSAPMFSSQALADNNVLLLYHFENDIKSTHTVWIDKLHLAGTPSNYH